ncbi:acetyl-CoA carboxylase biotin carboxylase subunit family protein [Streptomyces sp. NPDC050256]|uniref:ATP-grasp domain-containing protein n=1 Tax=unclassified Streptomyces TaxID=2593676 RepID=UPI00378B00EE
MSEDIQRVLLVMPEPGVLEAAAGVSLDVWAVSDRGADPLDIGGISRRRLTVDFGDADALHALLVNTARDQGIPHILYFGESDEVRLAVEHASFQLSQGQASSLHKLRDPVTMRRILNQSGVSVVSAAPVSSVESVRALVGRCVLPVVVKTRSAMSCTVIRDKADLDAWAGSTSVEPCLVEEYLAGPEVVVNTLSCDGMHQVIGMTALRSAAPAGVDLLHPAGLSEGDRAEIRTTVRALLDLTGHESGPVHTRVVLTQSGPRIASSRAWLSGNPVRRLMQAASGRAPVESVLSTLAGAPPHALDSIQFAALARLVPPHAGRILAGVLEDLSNVDYVVDLRVVEAGMGIATHAEVIVHGASPAVAAERLGEVRRRWESSWGAHG